MWPFPGLETQKRDQDRAGRKRHLPQLGCAVHLLPVHHKTTGTTVEYKQLSTESEIQTAAGETNDGIAKVQIQFTQAAPTDINNGRPKPVVTEGHTVPSKTTVVLRFNAIEPGSEEIDKPCK